MRRIHERLCILYTRKGLAARTYSRILCEPVYIYRDSVYKERERLCLYIPTHTHTHTHTTTHTHLHICVYIYTHTYIYADIYPHRTRCQDRLLDSLPDSASSPCGSGGTAVQLREDCALLNPIYIHIYII
jgi:hypothetical protein